MNKDYYLGLDIGTNSVGWAVTDTEYNLCKFKGKDMWGIRLFDSAETAANRRLKRTNRRRLQRRAQRIKLLQSIFADEMYKVDPTFFIRLNESKLHFEDKTTGFKHVLFADKDYSDIDYYKDFPTIYHLRKELIENPNKHDIRLVYMALHHIIKYRGHFLIEGTLESAQSFKAVFDNFIDTADLLDFKIEIENAEEFEHILRDNSSSKSDRAKKIEKLFITSCKEEEENKESAKYQKDAVKQLVTLIVGNKGDLTKIFGDEVADLEPGLQKFKFNDDYEERVLPEISTAMPDSVALINALKMLYDWSILVNIMGDEAYFSHAKVNLYNAHQENLRKIHYILKKYDSKEVSKAFFDGTEKGANYSNYIGYVKTNGKTISVPRCNEEDFYKNLTSILGNLREKVSNEDSAILEALYSGAEKHSLLPLQRSKDNSVVPMQVHRQELQKILENASAYLPFLLEKDVDGISTIDKIESIFTFRIPYYVGPLGDRHKNSKANVWITRKEDGYIYPWNFDSKVDLEKSNEAFIKRMTNKCTYLPWEDVLPKSSLLYQKYMVLNELNNLTIRGRRISEDVALKQRIFHDLFESHAKVTGKMLLKYLQKDDSELTLEDLGGFDIDFKASLSSYLDFKKRVFGDDIKKASIQKTCEDIICWATIYGDDAKMLEQIVEKHYGNILSKEQIKEIKKKKYSGWGQFSEEFLRNTEGSDLETGETFSIIDALWETNKNLMELLSSRFTFRAHLDELVRENSSEITSISYESLVEDLYTSPANKRAIWQTVQIAEEIRKVMKAEPKKIFIEMARGPEKDKKRTKSRKQQLIELYKNCDKDVREWALAEIEARDEREFNSIKLYLYYTQMGKCAYTGEPIDLDALMRENAIYDRDHIYPQSKIKDDSIDNRVLVKKVENAKKDNELLKPEIQKRMFATWKLWRDKGLISQKKFERLNRQDDFSDDELSGFIARQLVETRQSTKLVADLLERMYENTKIVRVKAGLVSDFREKPLNELKCRLINDYHHGKDAYLNIVVGNVYSVRFTDNPREWVKKNRDRNWSINKVFYYDVPGVWEAPQRKKDANGEVSKDSDGNVVTGTIDIVRKTIKKNTLLYTEYSYCETGQLFNETLQKKNPNISIPLKKGLETSKYGGYIGAGTSYFTMVEYDGKKGNSEKMILGVPIYVANMLESDSDALVKYLEDIKGMHNVAIIIPKIKKNALLVVNGFPMRMRGEEEDKLLLKANLQLILDQEEEETVRRIERYLYKGYEKVIQEFDGLKEDALDALYDKYTDKLLNGPYKERRNNQGSKLLEGRDLFLELNPHDKVVLLNSTLNMLRCGTTTESDLTRINGAKQAGKITYRKKILEGERIFLVNQSVTGLFENRTRL